MHFGVLGPLTVRVGDRVIDVGGPRQRRLLAALIAHVNQVVSSDRLIEIVFTGEPTREAATTLRSYVARLRRSLEVNGDGPIVTKSPGYMLRVQPAAIDAERFVEAAEEGRRRLAEGDAVAAVARLRAALRLWRGPAYDEFAYEDWARAEALRLDEIRLSADEDLMDAQLACGMAMEAVADLRRLIERHPIRDRLRGQLMLALFRSGRQVEALRAFDTYGETLAEVGLEPSAALATLQRSIAVHDPALLLAAPAGTALRGYRLGRVIGQGRHGVVYSAVQPGTGREVAVKAVHAEFADDPSFVRRFETEAQTTAHLEHPHIVPVYDFWREPGGAYLVMRLLPEDLSRALESAVMDVADAARLVRHLGSALGAAHRAGVTHGDIKPSNVLLDSEGNAYLSDFGLAAMVGGRDADPAPTSGFESPEQLAGEARSEVGDQFSLAVVVFYALTGVLPFGRTAIASRLNRIPPVHATRPSVPAAADEVLRRATEWEPGGRFGDIGEFSRALADALGGVSSTPAAPELETANPYRGLRPFRESDAGVFFGREAVVEELVARLADDEQSAHFLSVVGASGCGKSSLVAAGLLPRLRAGAVPGSDAWFIARMTPGADPFDELAGALRAVAMDEPAYDPVAVPTESSVVRLLAGAASGGPPVLLVIDQLEELFSATIDESIRGPFLDGVAAAVSDPSISVRVVATLRADFYDRPLAYRGFSRLVKAGTVTVLGMSAAELERAVTRPAARVDVEIEPRLVAQLVADVADQPAALPMLQYTLTELFERRSGRLIGYDAYHRLGGLDAAVTGRAEGLYADLDDEERRLVRGLFLRLVTVDEGGAATRRRARVSELGREGGGVIAVARRFGDARLVTFDRDTSSREGTVEVAHEALISQWPRLAAWVEEAGEGLRIQAGLTVAATTWDSAGRDPSDLYRGSRLDAAIAWADGDDVAVSSLERDFLHAGLEVREAESEAERRQLEQQRRANRRLRALLAGVAVALVVTLIAGFVAVDQRNEARAQERIATARELAAASVANLALDPDLSLLLAIEAVRSSRPALPEATEALHRAVLNDTLLVRVPNGGNGIADLSPDGRGFVTAGEDSAVLYVWNVVGDRSPDVLAGHGGRVLDAVYDPAGRRVASTSVDGTLRIWDVATGNPIHVLDVEPVPLVPDFSRDGALVAVSTPGEVWVFDVSTGARIRVLTAPPGSELLNLDFSPDGSLIAAADEAGQRALVWSLDEGLVAELRGHTWLVKDVGFTPDGSRLLTGSFDTTIKAWNTTDWALADVHFAPSSVWDLDIADDGSKLAAGGNNFAAIWDLGTGEMTQSFTPHRGIVDGIALGPESNLLLSASFHDETTRLWDLRETARSEHVGLPGPNRLWGAVTFSRDGRLLATSRDANSITLWDMPGGRERVTVAGLGATVDSMSFDPTGTLLATAGGSGVHLIATDTGAVTTLRSTPARDVAWSETSRLAAATAIGVVVWVDPASGEVDRIVPGAASAVAFNPGGTLLAMAFDEGPVEVARTESGEVTARLAETSLVWDLSFSADGAWLAAASLERRVDIWDAATFAHVRTNQDHLGQVFAVAMDPQRPHMATGGDDDRVRIVDLESGGVLLALPAPPAQSLAYSPDGRYLAAVGPEGPVTVYILALDELLSEAETRLTRGFTAAECEAFLQGRGCE